ncbi:FAD-dependent oxidoreductase [Synechococcus sp. Nb3U1]|uniref:FAD-dependent oxidoreductase n=1 Tax=Synechococcus sp. Nb3U1 TaxID=1914529 RepID=UPI001F2ACC85|nr:FAD-dependent oxidoreductase [Synechococcus sp. Nb3U1]MCF2972543.1 FAD-dependent oxidoreductase [Synechococcus sp. Nb3U1]
MAIPTESPVPLLSTPISPVSSGEREPVLVMGAGLLGRLMAVSLVETGHPVRIVDAAASADTGSSAAHMAAAMLAPLAESAVTEPSVVAQGYYSLSRWPSLLAHLPQPVFFQQEGTLILWHRQDQGEAKRFSALLAEALNRLSSLPTPQPLDAEALAEMEPAVAGRFVQGLYLPQEGQLDNRQLLSALLAKLRAHNLEVEWNCALGLEEAQTWQYRTGGWVLDCRGLGASRQWAADEPLRGVRGEVIRLYAPDVTLRRPTRLLHPRYPIYIAPKQEHLFIVGATEIEADDLSPISVRSTLELLSAAYAVHPAFAEARILELGSQCRPTLPDHLPAVVESSPRILQINGLYRHGFMIAPALHDAALEYLHQGTRTLAMQLGIRFQVDTANSRLPAPEKPAQCVF